MEAFHRALLDIIEVAHPSMMMFVQDLWKVATMADRDAALTAAGMLIVEAPKFIKFLKQKFPCPKHIRVRFVVNYSIIKHI